MNIPEPRIPDTTDDLDVVMVPNDNTDGKSCVCGHAKNEHGLLTEPGASEPTWRCRHCSCTLGYPAAVPSTG